MKKLILLLTIIPLIGMAQRKTVKTEVKTYDGKIEKYLPGKGIAYSLIQIETNEGHNIIRFPYNQGREIIEKFPTGTSIKATVKSRVNKPDISFKDKNIWMLSILADSLFLLKSNKYELKIDWSNDNEHLFGYGERRVVLLEEEVADYFLYENKARGVFTKSGILVLDQLAFPSFYNFKKLKIGSRFSNFGAIIKVNDGEELIVKDAKRIVSSRILKKSSGLINSFLYKQNGVCIGFSLTEGDEKTLLYFTPDKASKLMEIEKRKEPVTIYYHYESNPKILLYYSLHALISRTDTIKIEKDFYGEADGRHEYIQAAREGKITDIEKDKHGHIISIILNNTILVEANSKIQSQLSKLLKVGKLLRVEGQERIKIDGEVYKNSSTILIVPQKLAIDNKEFLVDK
jgi:hypothetical protein